MGTREELIMEKTFIQKCLDNEAKPSDIDKFVAHWHYDFEGKYSSVSLQGYLGMTNEEYYYWMLDNDYIFTIIESRKKFNKEWEQEEN